MVCSKNPTSSFFFFLYVDIHLPAPYVEKVIFSPLNCLSTKAIDDKCKGLFLDPRFCSMQIYIPILMAVLQCIDSCSFVAGFKIGNYFVILFKILTVVDLLHFPVNFRISLLISTKKAAGILIEIAFSLQISWGVLSY